jgi:hypothetical protein
VCFLAVAVCVHTHSEPSEATKPVRPGVLCSKLQIESPDEGGLAGVKATATAAAAAAGCSGDTQSVSGAADGDNDDADEAIPSVDYREVTVSWSCNAYRSRATKFMLSYKVKIDRKSARAMAQLPEKVTHDARCLNLYHI